MHPHVRARCALGDRGAERDHARRQTAALGETDRTDGLRRLDRFVRAIERRLEPHADFDAALGHERAISPALDGRTVFDDRVPRRRSVRAPMQRTLFDE